MAVDIYTHEFDTEVSSSETNEETPKASEALKKEPLSIKQYFEDQKFTPEQQKVSREMLRHFRKVNVASFFEVVPFHAPATSPDYIPAGKKLDAREKRHLQKLTDLWQIYVNNNRDLKIKNFFSYIEATRGHAGFAKKQTKDTVGALGSFVSKKKTERESQPEKNDTSAYELLSSLLADSDMDNTVEELTQQTTTTKKERKALEKTQKEQGRGTVSESQLLVLMQQAVKNHGENDAGRQTVTNNLVSYLQGLPQWPKEASVITANDLVQLLHNNPALLGAVRAYARMMPEDFQTILNGGVSAVSEYAHTVDVSITQEQEDQNKIATYLTTPEGERIVLDLMGVLHEKFRGLATFLEQEQQKIVQNPAKTTEEATSNSERYYALEEAKQLLLSGSSLRGTALDLIYAGGIVSVIPGAEGVGGAGGVRIYEGKLTDFVNHVDFHLAGFQQLGGSKTTGVGLGVTVGGTISSSKKNTLFYGLSAGIGGQRIGGLYGFGWNAGLTIGDEFWVNEKKLKSFSPVSKKFVSVMAGVGISGDLTSLTTSYLPWSIHAGLNYRRDKLSGLAEQEVLVSMMLVDIIKQVQTVDTKTIRTTVETYCTTNKIKQTKEEIDQVTRVLAFALTPYASLIAAKNKDASAWPTTVAVQIARHWYNTQVDETRAFALTGIGIGVGINFLGVYPQIGVQFQHRKSSVYMPDQDSEAAIDAFIQTAQYERKLDGTFASQVEALNSRFGLTEADKKLTSRSRDIPDHGQREFVLVPEEIVGSTLDIRLDIRLAPSLISSEGVVAFQKVGTTYEIPADLPIKIVDVVENNRTKHIMIVGDLKGQGAQPLHAGMKFAENDDMYQLRLDAIDRVYADQVVKKSKESLVQFFAEHTEWNMPFVVRTTNDIQVATDEMTKKILSYTFPLKSGVQFEGSLPEWVEVDGDKITIPASIELATIYSQQDNSYMLQTKEHTGGLSFAYTLETGSFTQTLETDANIDLLAVSPALEKFLSSTTGATMLLDIRHADGPRETTKNNYYKAIKDKNYQQAYNTINGFITGTEIEHLFADTRSREQRRADLYAIYGALSRVRMTEYKHLKDKTEKSSLVDNLFNQLHEHPTYAFSKPSEDEKLVIRSTVESGQISPTDQRKLEGALKKISPKFTGRGDQKYYYDKFPKRDDPFYKLLFLVAPIHSIYETRKTATAQRLKNEPEAQNLMSLYNDVGSSLAQEKNIFAENSPLEKRVGLVFGYETGNIKAGIEEKFVFHPHTTGDHLQIPSERLSQAQDYFLNNYLKQNSQDVRDEVDAIITLFEAQLQNPALLLDETEKNNIRTTLKNTLLPNGKVNAEAYKAFQKTGILPGLEKYITGTVEWGMAAYSDCVNFMLTKGQPKFHFTFPKTYASTGEPAVGAVELVKPTVSGPIVIAETVVANQADRRTQNFSFGVVGGVRKPTPEVGPSTTEPVILSEEDYGNIDLTNTQPSTVTINGKTYDGFTGKLGGVLGKFYDVQEGNIYVTYFLPDGQTTAVNAGDALYGARDLDMIAKGVTVDTLILAKQKQLSYDAYVKQVNNKIKKDKKNQDKKNK